MAGRSVQMGGMLPFLSLLCVCLFLLQSTDCKAVIRTEEGCSLDSSGFSLHIGLRDAYLPRMWVEKHPEKESEVCSFLGEETLPGVIVHLKKLRQENYH